MNKRKIRDSLNLLISVILVILYIPHLFCFLISKKRSLIIEDLRSMKKKITINLNLFFSLLYFLHNNSYFRVIFYHRLGPLKKILISWYRPGSKNFIISNTTMIGGGVCPSHPFSTIINADFIGSDFKFRHSTTLGNKLDNNQRPTVGNNVTLGASVIIIGKISIGDNVIVGAGTVITKDIPENSIVVGNPARIIKKTIRK